MAANAAIWISTSAQSADGGAGSARMSVLFALDFWKVPHTPTSKKPVKLAVIGSILAIFLLWFA